MFQNSFLKNNTPYTSNQSLMKVYEGYESARDNFGEFMYQFQPETKTLIRKLEKILNYTDKICLYHIYVSDKDRISVLCV